MPLPPVKIAMSDLNDPRVFFAAERTLLAWTRTSLTLMAFGFVVERFGLFVAYAHLLPNAEAMHRGLSFWIGLSFIFLGSASSVIAAHQYRKILRTLKPVEIPFGSLRHLGPLTNLVVALLGAALIIHLFRGSLL